MREVIQIADELEFSATAQYKKLGVGNRVELILVLMKEQELPV